MPLCLHACLIPPLVPLMYQFYMIDFKTLSCHISNAYSPSDLVIINFTETNPSKLLNVYSLFTIFTHRHHDNILTLVSCDEIFVIFLSRVSTMRLMIVSPKAPVATDLKVLTLPPKKCTSLVKSWCHYQLPSGSRLFMIYLRTPASWIHYYRLLMRQMLIYVKSRNYTYSSSTFFIRKKENLRLIDREIRHRGTLKIPKLVNSTTIYARGKCFFNYFRVEYVVQEARP